jgi:hypothetical protein
VLDGEITSSNSLLLKSLTSLLLVNHLKAATKIREAEIFQIYSELVTEIQRNASSLPCKEDISLLVCNTEVSAGLVTQWASMERDQTVNVT